MYLLYSSCRIHVKYMHMYISCVDKELQTRAYFVGACLGLKAQLEGNLLQPGPDLGAGHGGVEARHPQSQSLERSLQRTRV